MKMAKNNRRLAAAALGITEAALTSRIANSREMSAVYSSEIPVAPDENTTAVRDGYSKGNAETATDSILATNILRQDGELVRRSLAKAGIKEGTLAKLRIFDDMSENTGRFFVTTMDMTHRLQTFQVAALFEEAEYIRETYLHNKTLDDAVRIEWTKRYTEISELIGKTADRAVAGTEAVHRMLKNSSDESGKGKRKPGFKPIKQVNAAPPG